MNQADLRKLGNEQLLHKVWVVRSGHPVGILDQTINDIRMLTKIENVVKIEIQGGTLEEKTRQCKMWDCE